MDLQPDHRAAAFPGDVLELGHHPSADPTTLKAGPDGDPERRQAVALVPAAQHAVCDGPAVLEQEGVDVAADVVRNLARRFVREWMGPQVGVVNLTEDVRKDCLVLRFHETERLGHPRPPPSCRRRPENTCQAAWTVSRSQFSHIPP